MELTIPEPQRLQGILYPPGETPKEIAEFEYENIPFEKKEHMGMVGLGLTKNAKQATENRVVAYLLKTHGQAAFSGGIGWNGPCTGYQQQVYMAFVRDSGGMAVQDYSGSEPWKIWAKAIESALPQAKTKDGKLDLEDAMVISRIGAIPLMQAKRVSGSENYRDYKTAKDSKGEYIIPEKEQRFIDEWLAYYHSDVD